jgi:hypothetical protein
MEWLQALAQARQGLEVICICIASQRGKVGQHLRRGHLRYGSYANLWST